MALDKITYVTGKGVYVPGADVDTDRIIPARYMKVVTFDGLGEYMFRDVRFDDEGKETDHILNHPSYKDATIMVVGSNFGCGSSREHAPQAIRRAGFKAIIGESFAEIFYGNSLTLGMPCVEADADTITQLGAVLEQEPGTEIAIDIENERITFSDKTKPVRIKAVAKNALTKGMWDPIAELLGNDSEITKTADNLPYV